MKKLSMVLFCLVLSSLAFAGDVATDKLKVQVFVSDNVLYGVSDAAVLRSDLSSGSVSMLYPDQRVVEWRIEASRPASSIGFTDFFHVHGRDGSGIAAGLCDGEAATLNAAIAGVQAACGGGGGSYACSAAQHFFNSALSAYQQCFTQIR